MSKKELKKILLIEDELDIHTIAQLALEDIGHFTVKYCQSGHEALQVAEAFSPDLILLDMMMPGLDGIATLGELRKLNGLKETPVIFMTAKAQSSEIMHYHEAGAIGVITKPFDPMTLAETLHTIWNTYYG